ncbi:MAG: DNA-processing protein DprA [Capnocytophaga sp.]|nr:DNA-processing protein DprA [Capnocytophaga sp.]
MNDDELTSLIALKKTPLIGDITAKKLITHFGSAKEVYEHKKSDIERIDGIGSAIIKHLQDPQYRIAAEKELNFVHANKAIRLITYTDDAYPPLLKQCADAPVVLFQRGNINLDSKRIISIVGTRNITAYGQAFCEKLIEELAPLGVVVVSGMAYGVDITAHKAAIKHGLQTIGCLAHGLDTFYPSAHYKYAREVEENGGFFTDFGHQSKFDRKNFLSRNRIIAGLSAATVVIESGAKGGSLVTADIAFSYNRDVFAVPGRATDPYSIGCNHLIRSEKARILLSAKDLIYHLNWENRPPKAVQKQLFVTLTDEEQRIADYLRMHGKQLLDSIAPACEMPIHKASHLLFQLEMKDIVRALPGKLFECIV